ncbi:glutathione S-transferase family protein [Orbus mooreae]|uniref:glutathione S-transferase family protein n=1 Tax=Orbus mooreae TaxID=3074107 RepID=UPI00370D21CF
MNIYTYPKSRSLRVLWTLEELGATYNTIRVDLMNSVSGVKSPHPNGKVPFLEDENCSISETLAICIYICDKYADKFLYPTNPAEKAHVNSWISFALTDLESPVWNLLKQVLFTPDNQRLPPLINYFKHEASQVISRIKFNPDYTWIAGNNFTLADIFMSHTLLWAKICGVEINSNIDKYLLKAMSRPAFLKAQEINNG